MSLINMLLGKQEREDAIAEKERAIADGRKSKSLKEARIFANKTYDALSLIKQIDELLSGPRIIFSPAHHTKLTIPSEHIGTGDDLVILFSVCEDPQPICAWYEKREEK